MTADEYQQLAERTSSSAGRPETVRLLHCALGLCTEAGEFQDVLKRLYFYGGDFEDTQRGNLEEELGDLLWYIAEGANALGVSISQLMEQNIRKLQVRYPDKFSEERATKRNLHEEMRAMKKPQPPGNREVRQGSF